MSFSFTETLTIELPNLSEGYAQFEEKAFAESHALVTQIAAIHAGITKNFNSYKADYLESSLTSWYTPYPKPIIINHDVHSEPLGRVVGASMAQEEDGTPYIAIQAAIIDPAAVAKVNDKRYLTGSVGGRATEAACSVCGTDWAAPKENARGGLPCKHVRGRIYKDTIATLEMRGIEWAEYSFVNVPSDINSKIKSISQAGNEDLSLLESTPARFFVFDLRSPNIQEFRRIQPQETKDSLVWEDFRDIIQNVMKNTDVSFAEESNTKELDTAKVDSEESLMTNANEQTSEVEETVLSEEAQDDNVLDVVEQLFEDEDSASVEEGSTSTDEAETVEESDDKEDEIEEENRPEGQEKQRVQDSTADQGKDLPKSREDAEDELNAKETVTVDKVEHDALVVELASAKEQIADLTEARDTLDNENTKLRSLLKRSLAERVVDAKIAVGLIESDERATAIVDHKERTAASLVDSLKDLAKLPSIKESAVDKLEDIPKVKQGAAAVVEDGAPVEEEDEVDTPTKSKYDATDLFTDVFMGRKHL